MARLLLRLLGITGAGLLLAWAVPPLAQLQLLLDPQEATVAAAPVVAAAGLLAWALALWLALGLVLTLGTVVGGRTGALSARVLRRVAPLAVRRLLAVALGAGLVVGAGTAGPASADPGPTPVPTHPATATAPGPSLDWPTAPADPAPAPAGPGPAAPVRPGSAPPTVVVRPGDTLWGLAAAHLPPPATTARVAVAWPAWWAANRAVVGDDPDLLRPGQHLVVPPASG